MEVHVSLCNLGFKYDSKDIVTDVTLDVYRGETILILGPNSSGKTTLAKICAGLLKPTSGSFRLHGNKTGVAYVAQHGGLISNRSTMENLSIGNRFILANEKETRLAIEMWCNKFGISHLKSSFPDQLSRSEKKIVTLIRALLLRPNILVVDDLTSDLDDQESLRTLEMLSEAQVEKNLTVLLFSARLEPEVLMADRIVLLKAGKLEGVQKTEDFMKKENAWVTGVHKLKEKLYSLKRAHKVD